MTTGTYEEELPCGGTLRVTLTSWEIYYYFRGPDFRYNGTVVTVPAGSVEGYISAFRDNWAEYEKLKQVIPNEGDFSKKGERGMSIRIGKYYSGVCIQSHHMLISSDLQLQRVIDGYRYATQRAPAIQTFLASL